MRRSIATRAYRWPATRSSACSPSSAVSASRPTSPSSSSITVWLIVSSSTTSTRRPAWRRRSWSATASPGSAAEATAGRSTSSVAVNQQHQGPCSAACRPQAPSSSVDSRCSEARSASDPGSKRGARAWKVTSNRRACRSAPGDPPGAPACTRNRTGPGSAQPSTQCTALSRAWRRRAASPRTEAPPSGSGPGPAAAAIASTSIDRPRLPARGPSIVATSSSTWAGCTARMRSGCGPPALRARSSTSSTSAPRWRAACSTACRRARWPASTASRSIRCDTLVMTFSGVRISWPVWASRAPRARPAASARSLAWAQLHGAADEQVFQPGPVARLGQVVVRRGGGVRRQAVGAGRHGRRAQALLSITPSRTATRTRLARSCTPSLAIRRLR